MSSWSTGNYKTKGGSIYRYKSSWEAIYMDRLDSCDQIISWQYEPFYVIYHDGKKIKKYLPDFLIETIDGKKIIVEIKPQNLRNNVINVAKRNVILQKCQEESWLYYEWSPELDILPV